MNTNEHEYFCGNLSASNGVISPAVLAFAAAEPKPNDSVS